MKKIAISVSQIIGKHLPQRQARQIAFVISEMSYILIFPRAEPWNVRRYPRSLVPYLTPGPESYPHSCLKSAAESGSRATFEVRALAEEDILTKHRKAVQITVRIFNVGNELIYQADFVISPDGKIIRANSMILRT